MDCYFYCITLLHILFIFFYIFVYLYCYIDVFESTGCYILYKCTCNLILFLIILQRFHLNTNTHILVEWCLCEVHVKKPQLWDSSDHLLVCTTIHIQQY